MKTEEDEAFDELAKKQGDWGGGFPAKRQMAMDKLQEPVAYPKGDVVGPCICGSWPGGTCLKCPLIAAQPAQESEILTIVYQSGYHDGKQAALAGREWNFCERCGKRTADLTVIHTCTPPQEGK
jgi:hypothetical protein